MLKIILHIIGIVLLLTSAVYGDTLETVQMEAILFDKINQARIAPLETAENLGINTDQLLNDLPDMADILIHGLPALSYNLRLREAGRKHTADMLQKDYYDSVSPEGITPENRVFQAGYVPAVFRESLGIIGFHNFIDATEAVSRIFETLFRNELDPDNEKKRYILASDIEDVGIGFGSGQLTFGQKRYNAYVVTCDFGSDMVSSLEMDFLQMVNRARKYPLATAADMGLDIEKIKAELPELLDILENGIPPLTFNASLYTSASAHAQDMLENDYYSDVSQDGSDVYNRVAEHGYEPEIAMETMRMTVTVDWVDPKEGVRNHFRKLFEREMTSGYQNRVILNPELTEGGLKIVSATPEMWDEAGVQTRYSDYYTLLLVCDFGTSAIKQETANFQYVVYTDADQNGLFNFGEGISDVNIILESENTADYLYTDRTGGFSIPLEEGAYQISRIISEGEPVFIPEDGIWFDMGENNKLLEIRVQ